MTRHSRLIYIVVVFSWAIFVVVLASRDYVGGVAEAAIMISLGPLVMGFALAAWSWFVAGKLRDAFTWVVHCVSLALLIAWPVAKLMDDILMLGPDKTITFLIGMISAGVTYGWATWKWRQSPASPAAAVGMDPALNRPHGEQPVLPGRRLLPALFWLTLGLGLSAGIALLAGWISYEFVDRGPAVFQSEMGTSIHARDQWVSGVTGLLIAITGWLLGLAAIWRRMPRTLGIGLILGTTLLGIFFTGMAH